MATRLVADSIATTAALTQIKLNAISKFSEALRNLGEIRLGRFAAGSLAFSYAVDIARSFHRLSLMRVLARFLR